MGNVVGRNKYTPKATNQEMQILFVRHGLSTNNFFRSISLCGFAADGCRVRKLEHHCNAPLTLPGKDQAIAIGEILGELNQKLELYTRQVFTSDMARAVQTAAHIVVGWRKSSPIAPSIVAPLPFLSEMGSDNCITRQQETHDFLNTWGCKLDYGTFSDDVWALSQKHSGNFGKSREHLQKRVLPWLRARLNTTSSPSATPVVVCHGRYLRHLLGTKWRRFENTQPVVATYDFNTGKFKDVRPFVLPKTTKTLERKDVLSRRQLEYFEPQTQALIGQKRYTYDVFHLDAATKRQIFALWRLAGDK